ncbi:hypothetical protein [Mycobacterium sp. NAZ190054]|uniref:hypothetical protein n=1 Tax=Mycobacterium sp. NAZ190054 TaxID=1747766 RepID=UPI000794FEC9|nr:hypothetical protein [Mycobacterium sp. NAZ190054]KWX57711.1 hypothetical protein ASJ79_10755 [Mycobacterium sp. NAZ190054]
MKLKGLKRQRRTMAVAAATAGVFAVGVGIGAPIASAQEGETWTVPAVRGEILQNAVDAVIEAAGEENVRFNVYDRQFNQVVYNYTNWVVCGQSPSADSTVRIGERPRTVTFSLARPSTGC